MTVTSAAECLQQTSEAAQQIRGLLDELPNLANARVQAEHAYKKAYAKAIVAHKGERTDVAKAQAEIATESLSLIAEQAAANEKRCKEALHSWRSILSALQTVTTGYREEARFARTGPGY